MKVLGTRLLAMVLLLALTALARGETEPAGNQAALGDLETGRGVFLIDIGDPRKLNAYLGIIRGTHERLQEAGVRPDFVLVYIGPSVKYLTTDPAAEVAEVHEPTLMDIELNVDGLTELGIRQEVCAVATEAFGVDDDSLLQGMDLVGDGFISLIGYQARGYHLVPVF